MREDPRFHPDLRRFARIVPPWLVVGPRAVRVLRPIERIQRRRLPADVGREVLGEASIRLHRPPGFVSGGPALLWIHGGGFVGGTAGQDDNFCRHVARALGILVGATEYRVAPEHPYPVPLHDCYDALRWFTGRSDVDTERVAIGGASAGGGLAAALALLARERGEVQPVFQLLAYPMLDDRTVLRNDFDERKFRLWNSQSNRFGWQSYTGQIPGSDDVPGLAAPARHPDLAGLPPTWIGVGSLDLFHDEDLVYANRLRDSGVHCEVEVIDGAFHGFDAACRGTTVAKRFRASQVRALARAFGTVDGYIICTMTHV